MKSIVIDNVLEAIHYTLNRNGFKFSDKQLARADDFIVSFIDDLDINEREFDVKTPGIPKLVNDKRITPLIIKYYAFIEDNMTLYNELLEDKYLINEGTKIKYFALDKTLTKHFKKNEYKNILFKYEDVISSFYYSIRGLSQEEKDKIAKEFSDIVHIDHTTLDVGRDRYDGINHYGFLTKKNIELFGKDFLLKLNKNQRKIINDIRFNFTENDALKIKDLVTKYPDYEGAVSLDSNLLRLFTIDEINSMSVKDYILYDLAIRNNVFLRMKEILKIDPSFDCPKMFIKEEIFRVLNNKEIVELSDDAKDKISKIRIPEIDNVLVMPVRKINGIVLLDKASRKIDSIKGNHSK